MRILSKILFAVLAAGGVCGAVAAPDGPPPPPPDDGAPGERGPPPPPPFGMGPLLGLPPPRHEGGPFDHRPPPPRPRGEGEQVSWYALCVAGGAVALCVALFVLLLREMSRGKREATKKLSMLANVSHEFRTPMTNLRLYADMMMCTPNMGDAERRKYLRIISDEAERLARLVDNVLDYGRLAEHRRKYVLREIDLPRISRNIAAHFDAKAADVDAVIRFAGLSEATILADADAVRQVVTNLIDNALKYAACGKRIVLTVGEEEKRGAYFLDVADFGPGIPAQDAPKIFRRFFRGDNSLASGIGGAGLGLDIAEGLMRGMNGSLAYRPNPAGGSIFRATFPKAATGKEFT